MHSILVVRLARIECRELEVHTHSVPQFQLLLPPMEVQSVDAALSVLPLSQVRLRQLLDVVHHAVQVPLGVDLGAPSVIQTGQSLVVPDIGKHRLHRANALAVELPAPR